MQQRFGITTHLCTEKTMHHMITQCNTTRYDITTHLDSGKTVHMIASMYCNKIWHHHTFGHWKNSTHDCFNVMQQDMTSTHNCTLEKQHLWLLNVMQQDTTSPHILILEKQHTWLLHAMQQRYNIDTHLNTDQNTCCCMWLPVYTSMIRHHHTFEYWRKQHTLPNVVIYIHIHNMTLTHIQLLGKTTHIAMCSHLCTHLSCKRSDFISGCCSQRVLEALQHENL
jgi:hypothetical protein